MAGSMLSYFVLIPLFGYLSPICEGASFSQIFSGITDPNTGDTIFQGVRNIGVGGIFAAGIISIIGMSPVIKQALSQVLSQILKARGGETFRVKA